jgi:hypothetical protein
MTFEPACHVEMQPGEGQSGLTDEEVEARERKGLARIRFRDDLTTSCASSVFSFSSLKIPSNHGMSRCLFDIHD